jgi:hypothetical protein
VKNLKNKISIQQGQYVKSGTYEHTRDKTSKNLKPKTKERTRCIWEISYTHEPRTQHFVLKKKDRDMSGR